VSGAWGIRRLGSDEIGLIGEIDRSEHMDVEYSVEEGMLVGRPVDLDIPTWSRDDTGEFSVAGMIEFCRPIVERGAAFLGALAREEVLGLAVVDGSFEPKLAWCAFLHVSRRHRRRGVATALWEEAERIAVEAGAEVMYVSAVPSGSAVGFYLSRGCELAQKPRPDLFAREPEDIHLVCLIG
jgi:ribosomal protein S18 acetylase RimI-like enzyme